MLDSAPMTGRLTADTLLLDRYDTVVIGAGIGGITAAALLAHRGLSTLLVEQHYLPGGVCTAIKRQDVAMDAGAALLFGWSPGADSPHRYVMNVLEEEIDMIPHEALYRMHLGGGRTVTFWRDFERYFEELAAAFPGRRDQLRGFYDACFQLLRAMTANPMPMSPDAISRWEGIKMLVKHPVATVRVLRAMDMSLGSVLDRYVTDREVEGFFDLLIASCYCTTIAETPFLLGAAVATNTHGEAGGACYPAGSPQQLPNKLERALERKGGQVLYGRRVQQIIIEDGAAAGVLLDDGTAIEAGAVVSDADVYQLYGTLIPPEHLPPGRKEWAMALEPSLSAVVLYLSVDAAAIPEGTHAIEALIGDLTCLEKDHYFLYIPTIDDPSIAPDGVHSITVLCSAGEPWPRPGDPDYQAEDYVRRKQEAAERALDVVEERIFPNLRAHLRTLEVGTPSTIERYTLRSGGFIGGPKQALGQHLMNRLGARGELPGLYCVGDSTVLGEGVVSVTASAVGAANLLLGDRGMKPFLQRTFDKEYINHVTGKPRLPMPGPDEELTDATARRLAVACQWCDTPACTNACPAGVDVRGFLRRIEGGNYSGADRTIRETNPLGEVCGALCPAERLCEGACLRADFDVPVQIGRLQAWVSKRTAEQGRREDVLPDSGHRVAVVGGGPAGLSCAHFLARLGHRVELLERNDRLGGIPDTRIPTFRQPPGLLDRDLATIHASDRISLHFGQSLGDQLSLDGLLQEYDAVFLGVGLGKGRRPPILGFGGPTCSDALTFLARDAQPAESGSHLVVLGGGSVATDVAGVAARQGAQVTLVCPEPRESMPCLPSEQAELDAQGVQVLAGWLGRAIADGQLELVAVRGVEAGPRGPIFDLDEGQTRSLGFDRLVAAVGQDLDLDTAKALRIPRGADRLSVDPVTGRVLGRPGLYAGGDMLRRGGTIVEAVADGRRAAAAIHEALRGARSTPAQGEARYSSAAS